MNQHLLLVEDSQDDIVFMRRALAKTGIPHTLSVVQDGTTAVAYLAGEEGYADRARYPLPGVILVDLKMPLMTGFDVLRWVRSQAALAALIVIVFTSSDHPADVGRAYALGANSYLSKPGNSEELVTLVQSMADYWLTKNVTTTSPRLRSAAPEGVEVVTLPGSG
jgi:two-component system response regulator